MILMTTECLPWFSSDFAIIYQRRIDQFFLDNALKSFVLYLCNFINNNAHTKHHNHQIPLWPGSSLALISSCQKILHIILFICHLLTISILFLHQISDAFLLIPHFEKITKMVIVQRPGDILWQLPFLWRMVIHLLYSGWVLFPC